MPIESQQESELILALLHSEISADEFYRRFPLSRGTASARAVSWLQQAQHARDPMAVEFGLYVLHRFGVVPDALEVLCELAEADWHTRHESVVDALDDLRATSSIDVLYRTALSEYSYRSYDEARSLAVKCLWGLGNIGNEAAVRPLAQLRRADVAVVSEEASKQLARVAGGGRSEGARALAGQLLAGVTN